MARPADVLIPRWRDGKDCALDITVTSPLAPSNLAAAAAEAGGALAKAFHRKVQGAGEVCRQQGLAFVPVALETLGGFHPVAEAEVKKLGVALARHTGQDEQDAVRHLFQRLSLCLMRGNSVLLTSRCLPQDVPAEIDGIE